MGSALVAELRPDWPRTGWRTYQRIRAMESDRLLAAGRVRQSVDRYEDVRTAFNGITYAKGEVVIGMFEQWLGPDKFREGVRAYVKRHAWGNATAEDFLAALGAADSTVIPAFRSFVERPGAPLLDVALDCSGPPTVKLSQQRFLAAGTKDPASAPWVFPACFTFGDAKKGSTACTVVREEKQTFTLPGAACPLWVIANRNGQGYYLPRLSPALYGALPKAERVLLPDDYAILLGDVNLLATAGTVAMPDVLSLAAREAANPDARVALRAYALAAAVPDGMLDASGRSRYEAFVRHQFGDRARALGWLPRSGESPEILRLRQEAVPFVADRGADTALARKAMQLATRWLEHRSAIPPDARRTVLTAAARSGGSGKDAVALFDGLAVIAKSGQDANEREDVLAALGAFRDPALRARSLALALDPQIAPRSASMPLWTALQDSRNRPAALDWLAVNFDAVAARVPRESQSSWIAAADGACTDAERAKFVAAFDARTAGIESGARRYSLALERIDLCLAVRRAQQPSLNAFLATVR
jgi:alanyl aminopeptidase